LITIPECETDTGTKDAFEDVPQIIVDSPRFSDGSPIAAHIGADRLILEGEILMQHFYHRRMRVLLFVLN